LRVIYSDQKIEGLDEGFSIFLVGPSPRQTGIPSWRPEAIRILEQLKFDGTILIPERFDKNTPKDYIDQIEWEFEGLETCSLIVAWVPRKLPLMPAFTTNFEIGRYLDSGRLLYGRPDEAEKCRYLDYMFTKITSLTPFNTLESLLTRAALEQTLRKHRNV
jgi:hypothetical protein